MTKKKERTMRYDSYHVNNKFVLYQLDAISICVNIVSDLSSISFKLNTL